MSARLTSWPSQSSWSRTNIFGVDRLRARHDMPPLAPWRRDSDSLPDADDRSLARRQIDSAGPCSGCGLGDGVVEMGEAARAVAVRLEMGAHGPGCF